MWLFLKLCVGLVAFMAFAYFGTTVNLGSRTLFGHLRAIGQTKESQELVDGTKQAAEPLVDGVRRRVAGQPASGKIADGKAAPARSADGGAPQEAVSPADKRQLRRIISRAESSHATHR
jgi:hypothetical protein